MLGELKKKVLAGGELSREELISLVNAPLEELCAAADEIRQAFCKNTFDLCSIINGKSGKCSEDCKYCAQSAHYGGCSKEYPLLGTDKLLEQARFNAQRGVLRFSIVCSGKRLLDDEVSRLCQSISQIKRSVKISICVSAGLLDRQSFLRLKEAGADRIHNNLETSRRFFKSVCTTHTYDDKIAAIEAAKSAGLEVCSGGIIGLGESMEDRIDMALQARALGVKSVPLNVLNPIEGTPFEHNKSLSEQEIRKTAAIFRFVIPDGFIRLAGGRTLMADKGEILFKSGVNAAITGGMLTTQGITVESDMEILARLGYEVKLPKKEGN